MKRKGLLAVLVSVLIIVLSGCSSQPTEANEDEITAMTAEQIVQIFIDGGYPIDNMIVYTAETDWNELLGTPGSYTSKVNFADIRAEQGDVDDPVGGTVEVFDNHDDAKERFDYVTSITGAQGPLFQYSYLYENVYLRIDGALTEDQAISYKNAFATTVSGDKPIYVAEESASDQDNAAQETTTIEPTPQEENENAPLTNYDYKQFVDDTVHTFEPSADVSFMNYKEWNIDGTQYASTTFELTGIEHEVTMRFNPDMSQLFRVAFDGDSVYYNMDAEIEYMDSQN